MAYTGSLMYKKQAYEEAQAPYPLDSSSGSPISLDSGAHAPPLYNNVPPPTDEITMYKQRAQEIVSRLMSGDGGIVGGGFDAKQTKFDNDGAVTAHNVNTYHLLQQANFTVVFVDGGFTIMLPNSVPHAPSNNIDVADFDMSKYGFKIHIGGELMFRPLDYVGGECWDYKAVPEEMNLKELHSIIRQLTDDNVEVLSIHYKRFHLSMAAGLTPVDSEDDVTTLVEHWKEDGKVDVFVEMVKNRLHSVTNDQDSRNEHVETDVGTNEDDVSVDDVSFCSDREDDELVSLMTHATQVTQSAATHGPETDAIRQNRGDKKGYSFDKEYELEPNYLEDPTLHWSYTTDEDYDDNI
ncbi:hypothetical protein ACFE04_026127 [Oxalis oulophora]